MVRLLVDVRAYMTDKSSDPVLSECIADSELAAEIEKRSEPYSVGSDGVLFRQGEPPIYLYFVRSGEVDLEMLAGEKTLMRMRAGSGSMIGLPAIIGGKPYSLTAKVRANTEILQLTSEVFNQLLQDEPRLSLKVLLMLAGEVRSARETLSKVL